MDMNIFTADFDWISLLLVIGAGVVSLIKSWSKKEASKPVFESSDSAGEGDRDWNLEESPVFVREESMFQEQITGVAEETDYYKDPKVAAQVIISSSEEETETAESFHFDIRQAVISSEILKRPEY